MSQSLATFSGNVRLIHGVTFAYNSSILLNLYPHKNKWFIIHCGRFREKTSQISEDHQIESKCSNTKLPLTHDCACYKWFFFFNSEDGLIIKYRSHLSKIEPPNTNKKKNTLNIKREKHNKKNYSPVASFFLLQQLFKLIFFFTPLILGTIFLINSSDLHLPTSVIWSLTQSNNIWQINAVKFNYRASCT